MLGLSIFVKSKEIFMKLKHLSLILLSMQSLGFSGDCPVEVKEPVNSLTVYQTKPKNGTGLFATADALIINAYQTGLEFTLKSPTNIDPEAFVGKFKRPKQCYKWGWRVGLGYHTPHDDWEIYANWTSFNPSAYKNSYGTSTTALKNLNTVSGNTLYYNSARSLWKLRLNVGDINLGKRFYVSDYIQFQPFAGIKCIWVHQKIYDNYASPASISPTVLSPDKINFINQYWGIGIEGGINTTWQIAKGFSIIANVMSANVCGNYHLQMNETLSGQIYANSREKPHASKAVTDYQLGVKYEKMWNDCFYYHIQLAWEQHMFYNQLQWQGSAPTPTPNGDLGVTGVSLNIRVGF